MIRRVRGYLAFGQNAAPAESAALERDGYVALRGVFSTDEVAELRGDTERVFDTLPADPRGTRAPEDNEDFRYEMLNRSAAAQRVVADRRILDVIEPLLGEDCHVIANTAWRNPPREEFRHGGGLWHIDGGPHIPLPRNVKWDERIPHPVFAVGTHLMLEDCPHACGPTAVIPRSHLSGRVPPPDRVQDVDLTWNDEEPIELVAEAGDVLLFVSDVWHRRLPTTAEDSGRFFLQIHYGRRDIAQRLQKTSDSNQLTKDAIARATEDRQRTVIGLHPPTFYDG